MISTITGLISGQTLKLIVDNGTRIRCMDLERQFGLMGDNILVNLWIIRGMGMDISYGMMEGSIKVIMFIYLLIRRVEEWQAAWNWGIY